MLHFNLELGNFISYEYERFTLESLLQRLDDFIWYRLGWIRSKREVDSSALFWKFWKRRNRIKNDFFSLVEYKNSHGLGVFLLNKISVRKALEEHYDLIASCINERFDIDVVMRDLDDSQSFFWKKIFLSQDLSTLHILNGLFYGFGLRRL